MKPSNLFAFLSGAIVATGVTLLFTTEKGEELRNKVSEKLSKEEIDKLIAKLKRQREDAPSEDNVDEEVDETTEEA